MLRKAHSHRVVTGGEGGVNTRAQGRESLSCGSDGEEGRMKNLSAEFKPVGKGKSRPLDASSFLQGAVCATRVNL